MVHNIEHELKEINREDLDRERDVDHGECEYYYNMPKAAMKQRQ